MSQVEKQQITNHLLAIQNKQIHPFNGTPSGGWGWTSHSGSVPDGDDTPGTILALIALNQESLDVVRDAVLSGVGWLSQLQNSDGGFPTFSRGWGKLPFDQSCSDLTGHAILAMAKTAHVYQNLLSPKQLSVIQKSFVRSVIYLEKHQDKSGFWLPLWFGNQITADHTNPVYGTARVTAYLNETLQTQLGNEYQVILKLMT